MIQRFRYLEHILHNDLSRNKILTMIELFLRRLYVHNVSLLVPSFILHIEIWTEGPILCTRQFPILRVYLCQVIAWHRIVVKPLTETMMSRFIDAHIDDLVPDCSIYIANSPEIPQSCITPPMCATGPHWFKDTKIEDIVSHNNRIVALYQNCS